MGRENRVEVSSTSFVGKRPFSRVEKQEVQSAKHMAPKIATYFIVINIKCVLGHLKDGLV